ncbi:MAG TPA: cysteine--1-D-myo-inosityl 2-amino-2-deoxy-alpha-D-glucopyranoside ligase [Actinomycetaceae bacterium]|nr:cysteine--1-D-myo-inosityl 2-amino-2-deoxy-alpha-D-glucopyranoside ligase [Actinomycetaceae bacterium]
MRSWLNPGRPDIGSPEAHLRLGGEPLPDGPLTLYVCGVTPYDTTHLGHARTYLAFDHLLRLLRATGRDIACVQNVTDIDDPLLERALRDGIHWSDLAAHQTDLYREDMQALRILPPDHFVGVVETVPLIGDAVRRLGAAGAAYHVPRQDGPDDVYADLAADPRFETGLDDQSALALFAERGGDPGRPGKRDPLDPLLWRSAREGEPWWEEESLPRGRPGWHVECSAIAEHFLGGAPTITGGGNDLAFPHHPMSASHLRMLGHGDSHLFMHAGMLAHDGEKMSKSLGNLLFVSRLRRDHEPAAIRLALASLPWADDLEWRAGLLDDAEERLARWRAAARRPGDSQGLAAEIAARLADELDVPGVIALVDQWAAQRLSGWHHHVDSTGATDQGSAELDTAAVAAIDAFLGVDLS